MEKIIKKWGDSLVIRFNPEEIKINKLKEGSIINIEIKLKSNEKEGY